MTRKDGLEAPGARKPVVFPMRLGIDRMERLLVASFDGDPEFTMLEPQRFDDPVNGTGLRVLRYRRDGRVDVYWEPGVRVNREEISIGAGIADFAEVPMRPARFDISDSAVELDLGFADLQGREVRLKVAEAGAPCRRFPFLAPVGKDVRDPLRLFLVYMLGFDFVRRTGTEVVARIGDRTPAPSRFPIPRSGRAVYLMRYAAEPIIAFLNPPATAPLAFPHPGPSGTAQVNGMVLTFDAGGAIARASAGAEPRAAVLEFRPGFPDLLVLANGATTRGRWTVSIAGAPLTGGTYGLSRAGDEVSVELDVTDAWRPSGLPWSFRVFTAVVRSFRTWPTAYAWRAKVRLGAELAMECGWRRKE